VKWQGRKKSSNVDDRRASSSGRRGASIGGAGAIIILLISLIFGGPEAVLQNLGYLNQSGGNSTYVETEEDKEMAEFISVILADTEYVWGEIFDDLDREYQEPKLVLYHDYVSSACGSTSSAVGPFYCPGDQTVYIDLDFFEELRTKYKAAGDFAIAYVVSHEVGHHVQTLLGITEQMQDIRSRVSQEEYNQFSVRFELQADYLSGVWANWVEDMGYLEAGDIQEAIRAAEAVGDDAIQKAARGYVVPDSFTHGTSEQRSYWFYLGFETGDLSNWDTFNNEI